MENPLLQPAPKLLLFEPPSGSHHARFPHSYKLAPQPGVLLGESEKLKQVRYLEIRSVEDLYSEETLQILHEAILLDETMAKERPNLRRKNRRPF